MSKLYSELNKGEWSGVTAYTIADFVSHDGSSYVCIANHTNQEPPNATYWALLASKGDQGAQGIQGTQGVQGVQGDKGGLRYNFSTTITDEDPGQGVFRYNNATIGSVTEIYLDVLDQGGVDLTDFIDSWDDSTNTLKGHLVVQSNENSDATVNVWAVTGITSATGYRKVTVTYVAGALPADAEECVLTFMRAGDKGADGAGTGDVTSNTATSVNGEVVLFNGITGKSIKRATGSGIVKLTSGVLAVIPDGNEGEVLTIVGGVPDWGAGGADLSELNAPASFMINGKIVPSVTSNNLTVALKNLAGNDPSAGDPVYVRIGDTWHSITSALSVTKNAGANWCNAGSSELATKEIDYFVYLGYNATDGVVIGFSRIPYAAIYSDFSATSTNEKYCAISTITNAAAGDGYVNIGRFAATLSAGAGYTWTVPTFTARNLIQRPIIDTRWLDYVPAISSSSSMTITVSSSPSGTYQIVGSNLNAVASILQSKGGTAATYGIDLTIPVSIGVAVNAPCGFASIDNLFGAVGLYGATVSNKAQIRSSVNMVTDASQRAAYIGLLNAEIA